MSIITKIKNNAFTSGDLLGILWRIFRFVIIFGLAFLILYPIYLKFSMSIMEERDLYDSTVRYVPKNLTFENYRLAWEFMRMPESIVTTTMVSMAIALCQTMSCTVVAYGFGRLRFPFKKVLFVLVIITMLIPLQVIFVPLFLHFRNFDVLGIMKLFNNGKSINLLNSIWPFVLIALTTMGYKNGLYIYMLRQTFQGMPKALEEAAYIDGSGYFHTFIRIILPSVKPMMITTFLFSFVWQWTDTFYASLFLGQTPNLATSLGTMRDNLQQSMLHEGVGKLSPLYGGQMDATGSIIASIPLIILYILLQRYFVENLQESGIK